MVSSPTNTAKKESDPYKEDFLQRIVGVHWPAGRWMYFKFRISEAWNASVDAPGPPEYPGNGMEFPDITVTMLDPANQKLLYDGAYSDSVSGVSNVMGYSRDKTMWFAGKYDTSIIPRFRVSITGPAAGTVYGESTSHYSNTRWSYTCVTYSGSYNADPWYTGPWDKPYWINKDNDPNFKFDYTVPEANGWWPINDIFAGGVAGYQNPGDFPYENYVNWQGTQNSITDRVYGAYIPAGAKAEYYAWPWDSDVPNALDFFDPNYSGP